MRSAVLPGTGVDAQAAVVQQRDEPGRRDRPRRSSRYECARRRARPAARRRRADYPKITNVGIALWVDADRDRPRRPSSTSRPSVFLRNQNEAPTRRRPAGTTPRHGAGAAQRLRLHRTPRAARSSTSGSRTPRRPRPRSRRPPAPRTSAGAEWQGVTYLKRFDPPGRRRRPRRSTSLVRDPGCLIHLSPRSPSPCPHDPIRLRHRLADEQGWVLVSATILTLIMLSIGLVAAALIDNGTARVARAARARVRAQRRRGRALRAEPRDADGLAELGAATTPSPGRRSTTPARAPRPAPADRRCPNPQTLAAANSGTPGSARLHQRRRAQATSRGRRRCATTAARWPPRTTRRRPTTRRPAAPSPRRRRRRLHVRRQRGPRAVGPVAGDRARQAAQRGRAPAARAACGEHPADRPSSSGAVSITNNGNHGGTPIIDATGSQVIVRCSDPADADCANYEAGQIKPGAPQTRRRGAEPDDAGAAAALQAARDHGRQVLPGLPDRARTTSPGKVVWVEGCTSPPNLTSKVPTTAVRPDARRPGSTRTASTRRRAPAC